MSKALFWLAFLILVVFAVRSKIRKLNKGRDEPMRDARQLDDGEAMACCAHCHVYFPASESVHAGGLDYCSPGHVGLPEQ